MLSRIHAISNPPPILQNEFNLDSKDIDKGLIDPTLRLLSSKNKEAKIFENHANPVMLVFIR